MTSIRKAKKAWKSQYPFDTKGLWQKTQRRGNAEVLGKEYLKELRKTFDPEQWCREVCCKYWL